MSVSAKPAVSVKPLSELLEGFVSPEKIGDVEVAGLSLDSRQIEPLDCFVALQGEASHGLSYLEQALDAGASAVLTDARYPQENMGANARAPVIVIENLRLHLGVIANRFYDYPSCDMTILGVTGTNGKTSVAAILAASLQQRHGAAAYVGTLGMGCWPKLNATANTTPDLLSLQRQFATWRELGVEICTLEASSHALAQGRLDGVDFDIAIFTNLSHEHLDYHGSMAAYGESKRLLFEQPLRHAVINIDDDFGRDLNANIDPSIQTWPYGLDGSLQDYPTLTTATSVSISLDGIEMWVRSPVGEGLIKSPLLGMFNVSNLLAAIASLTALGFAFDEISQALIATPPIPGRMQLVNRDLSGNSSLPKVIVDYAHTPDGLKQSLSTLREMAAGDVICVFGCGGERDKDKRAMMGGIAEQLADAVIVTSDNPRNESPTEIVSQILAGQKSPADSLVELDRKKAIALAIGQASSHDVVLVAGKGHEQYQLLEGKCLPFSDLAVCREMLEHLDRGLQS